MNMKKLLTGLNEYRFGIIIGILISFGVVLTNVVFPSNKSDDGWTVLVVYLGLFALFMVGGYIGSRGSKSILKGAKGGAITALISIGMTMITFAVIDNIFIEIVSKQPDKIAAFTGQTDYNNMRDFINSGLLRGVLTALPVITILGAAFGAIGSAISLMVSKTSLQKHV